MRPLQILFQHPKQAARDPSQNLHRDDSLEVTPDDDAELSQLSALLGEEPPSEVDSDSPHLKLQRRRLLRHRFRLRVFGAVVVLGLFAACAVIVLEHPCHHRSGIAVGAEVRTSSKTARATDPRRGWGGGGAGRPGGGDGYRLPPADRQSWAHSACSREEVAAALADDSVTAIEADVLMGHVMRGGGGGPLRNGTLRDSALVAIMAHPPATTGDLSVRDFLEMVSYPVDDEDEDGRRVGGGQSPHRGRRALRKHIKLDFKTIKVVKPAMDAIEDLGILLGGHGGLRRDKSALAPKSTVTSRHGEADDSPGLHGRRLPPLSSSGARGNTLFLNANVLPGPGHRWGPQDTWIYNGDDFLNICLGHIALRGGSNDSSPNAVDDSEDGYAFSLGYVTDNTAVHGFSESDVQAMAELVERHTLTGVVLAVNARILAKDPTPFDAFFDKVPSSQILAWTGKFLLPISRRQVEKIKDHFREKGTLHRVGFDSEIAESLISGFFYDVLYSISSALLYLLKVLISWFYMVNGKVC